ncbi:aminotransferase class V-fold PLP-dependent enzyme [Bacillaceae bacterium SIJ1]|uniref:aminotransferase class V-fold PLP-dependent enzyme n=1 Tax=Litoribacterium kuwaitense TaxID=1398745 RepID=UPI0013EBAFFF|nr:aminotransferase class V-fold PLP-dependent enzyme [Litoribacterium kuwaitense]NGP45207.1 aminotransferase class V-fold PLP-dependent enzyme [Litoribacterium kuwaitense]
MIYLDYAATSFPKPKAVVEAVSQTLSTASANPGRGSYRLARQAESIIHEARMTIKQFFHLPPEGQVIFFPHATAALNQVIKGFPFELGDHIITTMMEHNAVRRPLGYLATRGEVSVSTISWHEKTEDILREAEDALRLHTKMLVITHGSNVTGDLWPLEELSDFAKAHGLCFVVDASQTAGAVPIHMEANSIDFLVAPGHKGLLGPQGTGVLLAKNKDIPLEPQWHGGTGHASSLLQQPDDWPGRFESGTLNVAGIAGVHAGIQWIEEQGLETLMEQERNHTAHCVAGLRSLPHVTVYGHRQSQSTLPVVLFSIDGVDAQEAAIILDQSYNIAVRAGLHCAPGAHEWMNTPKGGAIRASFGWATCTSDIEALIDAVAAIVQAYHGE